MFKRQRKIECDVQIKKFQVWTCKYWRVMKQDLSSISIRLGTSQVELLDDLKAATSVNWHDDRSY